MLGAGAQLFLFISPAYFRSVALAKPNPLVQKILSTRSDRNLHDSFRRATQSALPDIRQIAPDGFHHASVLVEKPGVRPSLLVRDGKSLAAAGGADVILSTSNSTKSMVDSIQGLRPDGRLVTMGADAEPLSVSLMDLISKRIRIIGSQQNGAEYLYEALDFVAQGKVKTIVETYPLAQAPKAYERVAEGKARFRAVLTM